MCVVCGWRAISGQGVGPRFSGPEEPEARFRFPLPLRQELDT